MGTRSLAKLLQTASLGRRSEPGRLGALSRGNLQTHPAGRDRAAAPPPPPGEVARDSRRVAADAGEQALGSACPASSAAGWLEPGRPVELPRGHAAAAGHSAPGLGGVGERER